MFGLGSPAKPWQMCSMLEGQDRQDHMELSELESTVHTYNLVPRERKMDPTLCAKKYRRSAAGGGSAFNEQLKQYGKVRSVEDLVMTIHHLFDRVLATRKTHSCMKTLPLCKVVSFVDDRVRAVQVEYVTHYYYKTNNNTNTNTSVLLPQEQTMSIIQMQFSTLNYHLLVGYLLTKMPSNKYELKFNVQAMRTSFAHVTEKLQYYLECNNDDNTASLLFKKEAVALLDEVMSIESLLHLCAVIVEESSSSITASSNESSSARPWMFLDHGSSISSIETLMRPTLVRALISDKQPLQQPLLSLLPKWSWSLRVASAYTQGNYVQLIRLFTSTASSQQDDSSIAWMTRCKICISPALSIIRMLAIRQWNAAFMKSERVTASELAEQLSFSSSEEAISFCKFLLHPTEINEHGEEMALFKVAPISKYKVPSSLVGCRQDDFVFGNNDNKTSPNSFAVDTDGVRVPSCEFMRFLIFSTNTSSSS